MEILFWYFIVTRYDHINHIFTILIHYFDNVYIFFGMGIANILTCINIYTGMKIFFYKASPQRNLKLFRITWSFLKLIYNTFIKNSAFLADRTFSTNWRFNWNIMKVHCIVHLWTCFVNEYQISLHVFAKVAWRLFWKHKI